MKITKKSTSAKKKLILASTSISRKKLLKAAKIKFKSFAGAYKENMNAFKDPKKLVQFLALGKAKSISKKFPNSIIIGADTFMIMEKSNIGKPKSHKHAKEIISKMSGNKIRFITGITLIKTDSQGKILKQLKEFEISEIKLKKMSRAEILKIAYSKNALKMAGSFKIEGSGGKMVEKIKGNKDNVIGLPIKRLKKMLQKIHA